MFNFYYTNFDNDVGFWLKFCCLDLFSPLPLPTGTVYGYQIKTCSLKLAVQSLVTCTCTCVHVISKQYVSQ